MKFIAKSGNEPPKIVDDNGNELGYQQGGDYVFNDKFGSRLGWINGLNYIYDTFGNRLGWIDGMNCIINTYNNKVGEIRPDAFYDNYGSRIDTIEALFSLLGKPKSDNTLRTTLSGNSEPDGVSGWIMKIIGIIFVFCSTSWGGRIGLGVGAILGILGASGYKGISTKIIYGIIFVILGALVFGIAGMIIEGIVRLIILIIKGIASLFGHKKDN